MPGKRATAAGLLSRVARIARRGLWPRDHSASNDRSESELRCGEGQEALDALAGHDPATRAALDELLQAAPKRVLVELLARGLRESAQEDEKYRIAEALVNAVYPKYKFSEFARIFLEDEPFLEYYRRFMDPGNWHSLDRKYTLDQLLKLTGESEGDAAECGVYKGASSYLICRAIRPYGKCLHLFDSFQGLSAPSSVDGAYWVRGAFKTDESEVRKNLREFENFSIYPGWIPERFAEVAGRRFSFVHIDVDLYEPTRDSVAFFYDRLTPGAVMLFDDYGFATCPGARLAVDEFLCGRPERAVILPTGQAFIVRRGSR